MTDRRPPPNVDAMYTLKVDNITYRTTPEVLKDAFSKYGEVGDVYIPRTRDGKQLIFYNKTCFISFNSIVYFHYYLL